MSSFVMRSVTVEFFSSIEDAQNELQNFRNRAVLVFTGSKGPGGADEAPIFSQNIRIEAVTSSADLSTWSYVEVPFWEE